MTTNESDDKRDAGARTEAPCRPRATPSRLAKKRSMSLLFRPSRAASGASESEGLSFQELQRLHARRMEVFGFGGWLASVFFYVLFLVWAYAPDETLEAYGLSYMPSKRWAVAVPAQLVATYLFSLVLYKALNLRGTPKTSDYATVVDSHTVLLKHGVAESAAVRDAETPPIGDLPLFDVNTHLFPDDSDDDAN